MANKTSQAKPSGGPTAAELLVMAQQLNDGLMQLTDLVKGLRHHLLTDAQKFKQAERAKRARIICGVVKPDGKRCTRRTPRGHRRCTLHLAY